MPKDLSNIALPAIAFEVAAGAPSPFAFGGHPNLPDALDWPRNGERPMHFIAQIDLAALPKTHAQAGREFAMPARPEKGTLFVFLPLDADCIYQGDVATLYWPDPVPDLPERTPPEDTAPLDEEGHVVDQDGVAEGGQSLTRSYGTPRTRLSYHGVNPAWREGRDRTEAERYADDLAYAAALEAFGIGIDVDLPTPEAVREPLYEHIPTSFQGFFKRGTFQWTWAHIFEFSKRAWSACHDLPIREAHAIADETGYTPRLHSYIKKMAGKQDRINAEAFDQGSGLLERFTSDHAPSSALRFDVQFARWMRYARLRQDKPVNEKDKHAFVQMLRLIDAEFLDLEDQVMASDSIDAAFDAAAEMTFAKRPISLRCLAQLRGHDVDLFDIHTLASNAFDEVANACQSLHPDYFAATNRQQKDMCVPQIQMFGIGDAIQNAVFDNEGNVLLMQVDTIPGLDCRQIDSICQIWITPDDLASGRLERTHMTFEFS